MDVFATRDRLIEDYSSYARSFIEIRDPRIRERVDQELAAGALWPDPLIQLNPSFEPGETIDELVAKGVLHSECSRVFRVGKAPGANPGGKPLRLHRHQSQAIRVARGGHNYVLTTGTGSGKSLAYIVPIVDLVLREGGGRGVRAIIVYPMNALANSQAGELRKFLSHGYPDGRGPVRFARYTGQERDEEREAILADPPDVILTNYVMLELILTRPIERRLITAAKGLQFLVLDELHTYRGRQGADVAMLVRRVRETLDARNLQCVGTSATVAGAGTPAEQRQDVAAVASQIFGADVLPQHVITESLRRSTTERDPKDPAFIGELTARVRHITRRPSSRYAEFVGDPLSAWIESTFGLGRDPSSATLVRARPRSLTGPDGAAAELGRLIGVDEDRCVEALKEGLLAGYTCEPNPETGFPVFAFRLHQFVSRGDTVYASLELEDQRYLTLNAQQFVPGDRSRVLLPVVFCRECGQEYYCTRAVKGSDGVRTFVPRELADRLSDEDSEAGFLYLSGDAPWPDGEDEILARLPEEWLEPHGAGMRVRSSRRDALPLLALVGPDGREAAGGCRSHYIAASFRFCLRCGVSYDFRQRSDFPKLGALGLEGRSTATTILCLSVIRNLKAGDLPATARKLLSFTDNRQDASLQAGHFNDFVEVGLLRAALYKAAVQAGEGGLRHEGLTERVFEALNLPTELYAADPGVRFQALEDTKKALRDVLGYRLYRDLKRGWRITLPNLEQCGLLRMEYASLDELCAAQDVWERRHPALAATTPEVRMAVARTLLDFLRRELAIYVDYLTQNGFDRVKRQSNQHLAGPWVIDENEIGEFAAIAYPRPRTQQDYGGHVFVSARGGFGQYLRRHTTFRDYERSLTLDETQRIIGDLLETLRIGGLVRVVAEPRGADRVPGYQVQASALRWCAGDGTIAHHDPIRVPHAPEEGRRTNPFFVDFYKRIAGGIAGLEAREHTAQVPSDERIKREEAFREARLPILFCSPTMELGVDIAELNAVNLRNIPPTAANYAQRSGRAGRSGQPALVFSYCATGSSHDQYFFRRPELMVKGSVVPPRIDLANEDLVRAHVHAVWLAETEQSLGTSLKDILDLSTAGLEIQAGVRDRLADGTARRRGRERARRVLESIELWLRDADWYADGWLDEAMNRVMLEFDRSCDRWRTLYRAARTQREAQHAIAGDHSRPLVERERAKRLRREAESQLELLELSQGTWESDFYSYRYFASEGFLPGYSFPRLPLSAYIPGRVRAKGRDEYLSRPRFLAISEFGPRSVVYHEGSRYVIHKVILPVEEEGFFTRQAKICSRCGYLHPMMNRDGPDLCERCGAALGTPLTDLFRLQNVSTKRREQITADEEERLRLGFEIKTVVRFPPHTEGPGFRLATVDRNGERILSLAYGQAATLWRINLGWARRRERQLYGFTLDVENGFWARNEQVEDEDDADPLSPRKERVIPYVEDRRNCLLIEPAKTLEPHVMASLQAALKRAIQVEYQLEDSELAAEPLPERDDRRLVLLYEAAEGGAGVLRRLVTDVENFPRVARRALELCHFDPATGADVRRAPGAREDCEAACYECLMSYTNQPDHELLDRQAIRDLLREAAVATTRTSAGPAPRVEHLMRLKRQAGSSLEAEWLSFLEARGLKLPSRAQPFIESCRTRPDFVYDDCLTAIYVDGPDHDYRERWERDRAQMECMRDLGYTTIRFGHHGDWGKLIERYPNVFGRPR